MHGSIKIIVTVECFFCKSYFINSQYPITSSQQKDSWVRIQVVCKHQKPHILAEKTWSLETKWRGIKHDVTKFNRIYQQIKDLNESGKTDKDIILDVLELYQMKHMKVADFKFEHCWQILKGAYIMWSFTMIL